MKKILILFITFLLGINLVSANVDTTDISLFNYGCKDGKVKMDATFDL
ncbi:MAG: hypothetical protein LBU14_00510 [Candidatus Peribacteria bacterium]|jgi:hypothetical protein|nr:hypothetical protein [Candidatus Peribacteria bacterium]